MPIQASPNTSQLLKLSGPADGGRRNSRTAVTVLKKIYVDEAKHVAHDISARLSQLPLAPAISTSASNLAQSLEADDSSMFPLSDPE